MSVDLRTVFGVATENELQCLYEALEQCGLSIDSLEYGSVEDGEMYATAIIFTTPSRCELLNDLWSSKLKP
jgi:hypothetical protein